MSCTACCFSKWK